MYLIGFYKTLDDAILDINSYIEKEEYQLKKGDLKEYPSTYSTVFDTSVYDIVSGREGFNENEDYYDDEDLSLLIRGYILDKTKLIEEIESL